MALINANHTKKKSFCAKFCGFFSILTIIWRLFGNFVHKFYN